MGSVDSKFQNLIPTIYKIPGASNGRDIAVQDISHTLRSTAAAYFMIDPAVGHTSVVGDFGYPKDFIRGTYAREGAALQDVRYKYLHNLIPGEVFREFEYVTNRNEYDDCEFLQNEYLERGTYWNLASVVSTHKCWLDIVSFNRLKDTGPFSINDKILLKKLLPHLSHVMELDRITSKFTALYSAVLSVLDMFKIGLIIVDDIGRVIISNSASTRAMEETRALSITGAGRIRIKDSVLDAEFQRLMSGAYLAATGRGIECGGQLLVSTNEKPILLDVMPLRGDHLIDGEGITGAVIFVIDSEQSHHINTDSLRNLFGLTQTEHTIASMLVNGRAPTEIAEERTTTIETVRSQIKAIYRKTGTNSQNQLTRLAVKADPPIVRPTDGPRKSKHA